MSFSGPRCEVGPSQYENRVLIIRPRNFVVAIEMESSDVRSFFFNFWGGTLGTAATTGLLYQPRMIGDGDCGEIGGMKIGRGNLSTRRKLAPAPLYPPQIPHD
jgi:hypothetical protein